MNSPFAPICNAGYFDNALTVARECPAATVELTAAIIMAHLHNPDTTNPNIAAAALDEMHRIYNERFATV